MENMATNNSSRSKPIFWSSLLGLIIAFLLLYQNCQQSQSLKPNSPALARVNGHGESYTGATFDRELSYFLSLDGTFYWLDSNTICPTANGNTHIKGILEVKDEKVFYYEGCTKSDLNRQSADPYDLALAFDSNIVGYDRTHSSFIKLANLPLASETERTIEGICYYQNIDAPGASALGEEILFDLRVRIEKSTTSEKWFAHSEQLFLTIDDAAIKFYETGNARNISLRKSSSEVPVNFSTNPSNHFLYSAFDVGIFDLTVFIDGDKGFYGGVITTIIDFVPPKSTTVDMFNSNFPNSSEDNPCFFKKQ